MKKFLVVLALLFSLSTGAQAQSTYVKTTLSAAIDSQVTRFLVASNSSFTPGTNPDSFAGNLSRRLAVVDHEVMDVYSASGSTSITVVRGAMGTAATPHKSGAYVFVGPPQFVRADDLTGSCSASVQAVLPVFSVNRADKTVELYNCIGGNWLPQTMPSDVNQAALTKDCTVPVGSVAYASFGTSTTFVDGTTWIGSLDVPETIVATGLTFLKNATVGTDKVTVSLTRAADGVPLANSTTAGTTTAATGSIFQAVAFTSSTLVSGPARYFVGIQGNGATDGFKSVAASTFNNVLSKTVAGTFGTVEPSFTAPTTFTADVAPIACLY